MYLVSFTNFGYTKDFPTKEQAQTYMERAGFAGDYYTDDGQFYHEDESEDEDEHELAE